MNQALNYVKNGYKYVEGWFSRSSLMAIYKLSNFQCELSITGSLIEIGVHHGRSSILLNLCTKENEIAVAYDLFKIQDQNEEQSGSGDKKIFIENLKKYHCDLDKTRIIQKNSLELTADKIINDAVEKSRIFIIDGGHTYDVVSNDLSLASEVSCEGGIIIVDDYFDSGFPAVSEATINFINQNDSLIPFLIIDEKVFFTNSKKYAQKYYEYIDNFQPDYIINRRKLFGVNVCIAKESPNKLINYFRQNILWQKIKNTTLGNLIRKQFSLK